MDDSDLPLFQKPQKPISDPPRVEPAVANNPNGENLRRATECWIAENPKVYALFLRFAKDMAGKGKKFGVGLLAERCRWEVAFEWGEEFRVNNNYRAYIARRLVMDDPGLNKFLTFRETKY